MISRRTAAALGTIAATLTLAVAQGTVASATTYEHAWNDTNTAQPECLGVWNDATTNRFNNTVMWYCNSNSDQQWVAVASPANDGYYLLKNANDQCLIPDPNYDIYNSSGKSVYVQTCPSGGVDTTQDEEWYPYDWNSDGTKMWYNRDASSAYGVDECLSVSGGSAANGAQPILWRCQYTADQYWGGAF